MNVWNNTKKERLVILTLPLYFYSRLNRDVSKTMYGLLSATILNASDDVCSSWTLAQVDNWKHLISDKYIIGFLLFCFLRFQTRSEQNEMFLFTIDKLSLSISQRKSLNCLDVSPNSPY